MRRATLSLFSIMVSVLSLFSVSTQAKDIQWLDQDTLYLSDYSVKLRRPGNSWRVLPGDGPSVVKLRYDRSGQNVSMLVRELTPIKTERNFRRSSKSSKKTVKLVRQLLMPFEAQGIQFYDSYRHEDRVFAAGTNANKEIIFLQFQLVTRSSDVLPIVLEMTIPREYYHDFNEAFFAVAQSFGMWAGKGG